MKKIVILVLFLIGSFTLVNADADSEIVTKVKTVDITELKNKNEYGDYIHLNTNTNWDNDYIYYDYSYYMGHFNGSYMLSAIASADEVLSSKYMDITYDEVVPFEDELFAYRLYYVYDDEHTIEDETVPPTMYVYILDKELNLKKTINLGEEFFYEGYSLHDDEIFKVTLTKDGEYLFALENGEDTEEKSCSLAKIDKDYNGTLLDCNTDKLRESFPDYSYEEDNDLKDVLYDKLDNKLVYLKDNKLSYLEDDKEKFNIEINEETKIKEFKLMNDYLIAINYSTIDNVEGENLGENYISELSVYDKEGKLVQNIKDNSAFVGLDVNNETNQFVVLKKYVDGICNYSYAGNLSCETEMKYDVYQVKGATTKVDDSTVDNPDTHDLIIIMFGMLILGSLGFIIFRKKLEY